MAEIKIENKKDLVVWIIKVLHLKKDTKLIIDNGLSVLAFVNGKMVNQFSNNENKLLNEGNFLTKTFGKKAEVLLYVFNSQTELEVRWGVGKNPISYIDNRLRGAKLELTAYGFCKVRIINAKLLMEKMPESYSHDGVITSTEIAEFLQRELISKVHPHLTTAAAKIGDFMFMPAKINQLTDALTFSLSDFNEYGIRVIASVIEGLDYTDDSRALINKETIIISSKMDTEIITEKTKQKNLLNLENMEGN